MHSRQTASPEELSRQERLPVYAATLVLLCLSLVFYRERVIFSDSAAYIMHMMSRNDFEISMHSRFVGALTQLLPLAAYRCQASLDTILRLYSLNSILIPVTCILVSMRWFRETRTAWSILLFYTLLSTWMFFYPVSELQQGLCLFLFYHGAFDHFNRQDKLRSLPFLLLSLLLIPTIIFSHPLALPIMASWLLLRLLIDKISWKPLSGVAILAVLSYIVKSKFFSIAYEDNKAEALNRFRNISTHDLADRLGRGLCETIIKDSFLLPLAGLSVLGILLYRRRYSAALAFLLVLAGWWVLITVSFSEASYDHYYEHMYQALPFFIALYTCNLVLPLLKRPYRQVVLLAVFSLSVVKICNGAKFHHERFAWFRRCFALMEQEHCKKAAFTAGSIPGGFDCPSFWSVPYETLLLSTLQSKPAGKCIWITGSIEQARAAVNEVYDIDTMDQYPLTPPAYFDISGYRYCVPEDKYSPEQISKIMYKNSTN